MKQHQRLVRATMLGGLLAVVAVMLLAAIGGPAVASSKHTDHGTAASHSTRGTAGTSGEPSSPQPLSKADQNSGGANGKCPGGPYCSTRDGAPSMNGNGGGRAVGKPCAGCVGKADNKNPRGQYPNGSDHNAGYECDRNHGIGQTNPAHTGCAGSSQPPAGCVDNPSTPQDECGTTSPPPGQPKPPHGHVTPPHGHVTPPHGHVTPPHGQCAVRCHGGVVSPPTAPGGSTTVAGPHRPSLVVSPRVRTAAGAMPPRTLPNTGAPDWALAELAAAGALVMGGLLTAGIARRSR